MSGIYGNKQTSLSTVDKACYEETILPPMAECLIVQSNVTHMMIKYLLDEMLECCGLSRAKHVAYQGGFFAGEDFLYKHLNLQDTPESFCAALMEKNQSLWFPQWNFQCVDTRTGCLHISFDGMCGCRGKVGKKPTLQCEFMQGYLLGILECYTGCSNELKVHCKSQSGTDKQQCKFEIIPKTPPSPTAWLL